MNKRMILLLSLFSASLYIAADSLCCSDCGFKRVLSSVCILFHLVQMFSLVRGSER